MMETIENNFDALVTALTLSITAPTDAKSAQAVELADYFAAGMDAETVERAKEAALDASAAQYVSTMTEAA